MKLNIGCGPQRKEGYIGIDLLRTGGADVVADGLKLPIKRSSISAVYTSHVIEHFDRSDLPNILTEWARVLHQGGALEIICPDLERAMTRWLEGDYTYRWGFGITTIFGKQTTPGQYHYNGFTQDYFVAMLPRFGFLIDVIRNEPNRHRRDSGYIRNGDIYVKAVRK